MYKKISLIAEPEDMQDVLDEFIDRFGEPPREVMRLLKVSLIRALSARCGIRRIELRGGLLNFTADKLELSVWSELFGKYKTLSFRSGGSTSIVAKVHSADDAIELSKCVVTDYYAIKSEDEINAKV